MIRVNSSYVAFKKREKSIQTKLNLALYFWIEDMHLNAWLHPFVPVQAVRKESSWPYYEHVIWFTHMSCGGANWQLSSMQEKCWMMLTVLILGIAKKRKTETLQLKNYFSWQIQYEAEWLKNIWKPFLALNSKFLGGCLGKFFFSASFPFPEIRILRKQTMK